MNPFKLLLFIISLLHAFYSFSYEKMNEYKKVEIEGYIQDNPRVYESKDGKYKSYSFKISDQKESKYGDQYVLVTFKEIVWGEKMGEDFKWKKGDKIKYKGKLFPAKKNNSGLVGSFYINDYDHSEFFKKIRKPASLNIKYLEE
ncbi:hypothetical protein HBN50_01180 [Halobacteriovorax sp. GB3]|uniref:hypothetical protein n=1 Tax=Halobacteriovorax sp. GB3 TaxID=2719615 RepID=UPI0023629F17|nr:hypothetical protein [Halobacteriovorax sp. GB3]MDD0851680.1 hypothetical protein [Halobacteriovorax sp. GB3]